MHSVFSREGARKEKLGDVTKNVLDVICKEWPANPFDVGRHLGENGKNKTISSKYLYHFRKLKQLELIEIKRTGNTYVAWPMDMEKLRVIHEMLRV